MINGMRAVGVPEPVGGGERRSGDFVDDGAVTTLPNTATAYALPCIWKAARMVVRINY